MQFVLLFLFASLAAADSTFRFGAVLSSTGSTAAMYEPRTGYQLVFDTLNADAGGKGFFLGGKGGTGGYHFKFEFLWRDDRSDPEEHARQVVELIEEEKIHFLGGSHPTYAEREMHISNQSGILNYHCCVGPDVFYEKDRPTVFGIPASNREYAKTAIRHLTLEGVGRMGFVYENDNTFTRTTCEAGMDFAKEIGTISVDDRDNLIRRFNETTADKEAFFRTVAEESKRTGVEAIIACVFPDEGKLLVDAFHDLKYPLKAFFLTTGPTKHTWVDSFTPEYRANDLLSAAQWHHDMKYEDDFFGSALRYTELYQSKNDGLVPTYNAASASAVGVTLVQAIRDAFARCDISGTKGDVDALLFDPDAISCEDGKKSRGYDRVLTALADLDMKTFFGGVKFNYFRRNVGMDPVTTQVFERVSAASGKTHREIEAVLPLGYATELIHYPATNHYKETCGPGFYIGPNDFTPCEMCNPGEISDQNNSKHCDSCPVGYWTNKRGQSKCTACPEGTYTVVRGARKKTDCVCKPGYFNVAMEKGVPCDPCPEGALCEGGTTPPVPYEGYWANDTMRVHVYACDPAPNCLGGPNVTCRVGYTGRLCSVCDEGYFSVIQKCYECSSAGLLVISFILLLVGWYVINVIVSRSVSSLEMILGWAQLANIIGDVNLNWTWLVSRMFGLANILDFDVDILEPSCLLKWGFSHNFVTQLGLPFVMTFMGCSGYFGSAAAYVMLKHNWITLDGRRKEILSFFVSIPENQEQLKEKWDATLATFLASVDITYVTIAKYCFDVFKCENIAGVSVLRVDADVVCNKDHAFLIVLASLGIVFYVVGYLLYVCWKLYDLRNRCAFADPQNLRRYGFIYQKFELEYYYTPALILVRKLLFVLVLVYMNNPAFQVGAIAIIINASLMIHVYTAPYIDTYLDVLFSFLLVTLMFEAFGGLMFYSENLPADNREILEWLMVITLCMLIAVFLVIFVIEMTAKYHVHFMKGQHRRFARGKMAPKEHSLFRRLSKDNPLQRARSLASSIGSHEEDKNISFELLGTFKPSFLYQCLRAKPDFIEDWDKLTNMLKDFMSDQADISYLSMDPVAKFWRKLVDRFPELVDFLAVADDDTRTKFNDFATNLYRNFYLSNKVTPLPLVEILNWRDYAPMAQWLAIAPPEERKFFTEFICKLFRTIGNDTAAEMLETKLKTGGPDPVVQEKAPGSLTKKQKKILSSLHSGVTPFHHTALKQLDTSATVALGVSKFRALSKKATQAASSGPSELTSTSPERISDEAESEGQPSVPVDPKEGRLNNQSSFQSGASVSTKKSVSFNVETRGSAGSGSGSTDSSLGRN